MIKDWEKVHFFLEDIAVGDKRTIIFKSINPLSEIKAITSSCGCSSPEFIKETGEVKVIFKALPIPYHLRAKGFYSTTKTITVHYKNGTKDSLSFNIKIYQK